MGSDSTRGGEDFIIRVNAEPLLCIWNHHKIINDDTLIKKR